MDLKNLLTDGPLQGARVGGKKTVEDIRQGLYKRTGAKSSSEGRTLRSIQVRESRTDILELSQCTTFEYFLRKLILSGQPEKK